MHLKENGHINVNHTTYPKAQLPTHMYIGGLPGTRSCGLTLSSLFDSEVGSKVGNPLLPPLYVHALSVGTCEHGGVVPTAVGSVSSSPDQYCLADQLVINLCLNTPVSLVTADLGRYPVPDFLGMAV